MRQFRVHCPACGNVLVKARDITVSGLSCCFDCPRCGDAVRQPATQRETELLAAQGAEVVPEASAPPPLTLDDLITLHQLLQDDDWMQSLVNVPASRSIQIPAARAPHPLDRQDG